MNGVSKVRYKIFTCFYNFLYFLLISHMDETFLINIMKEKTETGKLI
jgi:hypothetical protein